MVSWMGCVGDVQTKGDGDHNVADERPTEQEGMASVVPQVRG